MDKDDEVFRQERIATIRHVRHSFVRINYKWKLDKDDVIVVGTVVSKTGNTCVIIANDLFHKECIKENRGTFGIRFPISDVAYGEELEYNLASPIVSGIENRLIKLELSIPGPATEYIWPAIFETEEIKTAADVDVFMFPRQPFPAPPLYSPGSIVDTTTAAKPSLGYLYADVPVDEYGHFGSPMFNCNGHIVGIIFASQSRLLGWSVQSLQARALKDMRVTYAAGGKII